MAFHAGGKENDGEESELPSEKWNTFAIPTLCALYVGRNFTKSHSSSLWTGCTYIREVL